MTEQWISVSQVLPDEEVKVLLYGPEGIRLGHLVGAVSALGSDYWNVEDEGKNLGHFTHWMPLPAPPELVKVSVDKPQEHFVFLDQQRRPYFVSQPPDESVLWVYYWHDDQHWVSLRPVLNDELLDMRRTRISAAQAEIYHQKHAAHIAALMPSLGATP